MSTTIRMTFEEFTEQMDRLAMLPGFDRLGEKHWADYYAFVVGYFPHELERAVTLILASASTEFFPPPGKVLERMDAHRLEVGGRDWDSTLAALEAEAGGREVLPAPAHTDKPNVELLGELGAMRIGKEPL